MGKYMKKSTTKSVLNSMEISISSAGVRTRAKTLALQNLQNHKKPSIPIPAADPCFDEYSYLELRSRRLLKLKPLHQNRTVAGESDSCPNIDNIGLAELKKVEKRVDGQEDEAEIGNFEGSFAENDLDFEAGQIRASRESTPCNSVRGSECFGTPGSTTRSPQHRSLPRIRVQNTLHPVMPTSSELEDFFAFAEQQQHRLFMDKYNFDVASERPVPGRYDWVPVNP